MGTCGLGCSLGLGCCIAGPLEGGSLGKAEGASKATGADLAAEFF